MSTDFKNNGKITLAELDLPLQTLIGMIEGTSGSVSNIYPNATKVENLGDGKIKINDVETIVYQHPLYHPVSMITGLSSVATTGNYADLLNKPVALPASDVYDWAKQSKKPSYSAEEINAIPTSSKGTSNGVATLDDTGRIPSEQLPPNLESVASSGTVDLNQIPLLDITDKLTDNENISLVLGGMDSKVKSIIIDDDNE